MDQILIKSDKTTRSNHGRTAWDEYVDKAKREMQEQKGEK